MVLMKYGAHPWITDLVSILLSDHHCFICIFFQYKEGRTAYDLALANNFSDICCKLQQHQVETMDISEQSNNQVRKFALLRISEL